jgi:glycosyltransferase involved in cell wall biosynthesis
MKRICVSFITSYDVDCGIARYSAELISELRKFIDIFVVPFGPQVWERLRLPSDRRAQRKSAVEVATVASLADLVHIQFQPQLFGGMHPMKCTLPILLKRLSKPAILTVHELDIYGNLATTTLKLLINAWLLRRKPVKRIIAHNRFTARWLVRLGVEPRKISIIPMWAQKPSLPKELSQRGAVTVEAISEAKLQARKMLGLKCKHAIGIFGFIVKRRGHHLLLKALEPFPDETLLIIIGGKHPLDTTDYYETIMEWINRWRFKDRVITTGFLSDESLPMWLCALDFVVAPFTHLTESASLLRCISYGLPIVCSDLEPLRELHERANCARLFATGEIASLRKAILELLEDEELRMRLAQNAIAYAHSYNVEHATALTLRAYEETLKTCT